LQFRDISFDEAVIRDIQTDYAKFESCVIDGQFLLEMNNIRLIIILSASNYVQIEAGEKHRRLVKSFIRSIGDFLNKHNFYKGKNLNFNGGISFLNAGQKRLGLRYPGSRDEKGNTSEHHRFS